MGPVDEKYQHLDDGLNDLNARVTGLETKVDGISTSLVAITNSVNSIKDFLSRTGKFDPKLLIAVLALFISGLSVGAVVANLAIKPIDEQTHENREAIEKLSDRERDDRDKIIRLETIIHMQGLDKGLLE